MTNITESQVLLPGFKDGSWWIIRSDKNVQLPLHIARIHNFDQKGFALFETEKSMGVLNAQGEEVCNFESSHIESMGEGLFLVSKDETQTLIDMVNRDTIVANILNHKIINKVYVHFSTASENTLIFLPQRKRWPLSDEFNVFFTYYNSAYIAEDSVTRTIFTPYGERVPVDSNVQLSFTVCTYLTNNAKYALTRTKIIQVPKESGQIVIKDNYLSYSNGRQAFLEDLEENKILAQGPYDEIFPFPQGGYEVKRNQKMGLMSENLLEVIPPSYDNIVKMNDVYHVSDRGLTGLMDQNFKMVIPCEFNAIRSDSNFYYTESSQRYYGLYSMKFERILATQYTKIVIRDRLVKAYVDDKIRIIKLDEGDKIVSDIILSNAVTARQTIRNTNFVFDRRLLTQGWFYERKTILDTSGVIDKYVYQWGLKDKNDSILVPAKYLNPTFVYNASFTRVNAGAKKITLEGIKYELGQTYQFIQFNTGRKLDFNTYLSFHLDDGLYRNFNRCSTTEGNGILDKDGKFKTLNYISKTKNRLVPFAKDGKLVKENSTCQECIPYLVWLPIDLNLNSLNRPDWYQKIFSGIVRFEEAKWNFLDTNGENRFQEDFTFANDFYRGTSIVKRKAGWGVVNSDSLIIPCEYSNITRLPEFEDTLFKVQKNASSNLFLDSNLQEVVRGNYSLYSRQKDLVILESGEKRLVFYKGRLISDEFKNASLISESYWCYRSKRKYYVMDTNGGEFARIDQKPLDVFSSTFLLAETDGKIGILSSEGDTIIPFAKQEIIAYPHFFHLLSKTKSELYDRQFKLIRKHKKNNQLIPNQFIDQYALVHKQNIKIYDLENTLIQKLKSPENAKIKSFNFSYFLGEGFLLQDTHLMVLDENERVFQLADGTLMVENAKGLTRYYWKDILSPLFSKPSRSVQYIGHQTVLYEEGDQTCFIHFDQKKEINKARSVASFSDGYFLIKTGNKFMYLNEDLEVQITKYFKHMDVFENGFAAVNVDGRWTLMNKTGRLISYPSFDNIKAVSTNLYQSKEAPKYGLIDAKGKEIIPCKYEQISVISVDIIQVVLKGKMGYFNRKGEEIFPIQ